MGLCHTRDVPLLVSCQTKLLPNCIACRTLATICFLLYGLQATTVPAVPLPPADCPILFRFQQELGIPVPSNTQVGHGVLG